MIDLHKGYVVELEKKLERDLLRMLCGLELNTGVWNKMSLSEVYIKFCYTYFNISSHINSDLYRKYCWVCDAGVVRLFNFENILIIFRNLTLIYTDLWENWPMDVLSKTDLNWPMCVLQKIFKKLANGFFVEKWLKIGLCVYYRKTQEIGQWVILLRR